MNEPPPASPPVDRQSMNVDIVCVGFGPAMGGFLTTLSKGLTKADGTPVVESTAAPGMPPQVICYERADDLGFGVSGVVTPGRSIKASFPQLDPAQIPMAAPVKTERTAAPTPPPRRGPPDRPDQPAANRRRRPVAAQAQARICFSGRIGAHQYSRFAP